MSDIIISRKQVETELAELDSWIDKLEKRRVVLKTILDFMGKNKGTTKNHNAAALGKLGGSKGGKARAANLSPEQRQEIARNAARKRWNRT